MSLRATPVNDVGLKHIATFAALQELHLEQTQLTDAGLEHLEGLSRLRALHLEGAKVTAEGVEKLRWALLYCDIHWRDLPTADGED